MILYSGESKQFIEDTTKNIISDKLYDAYTKYYGFHPNNSEANSWTNSLMYLKDRIIENKLLNNMVVLECELPYTNERIDCLLFGKGNNNQDGVVLIELKQWSKVEECDIEGNVITSLGGGQRMVPHPSFQVEGYHLSLNDFFKIFREKPEVTLSSCVYAHNYSKIKNQVLFADKFKPILEKYPVFSKEDYLNFGSWLKERLSNGNGLQLFNRFETSEISPSKKLLECVKTTIGGNKAFNLIGDQITAYNTIADRAKKSSKQKNKSVIIIEGGPGTGKSVIALNVLAELAGKKLKVFHATGSKSFTETLHQLVGTKVRPLFRYFNNFPEKKCKENEIDVLICDEAHRIRTTSNSRFTRSEFRSEIPQIDELVRVAKVSIFFIDNHQMVRPGEIGSTTLIEETAQKFGGEIFKFKLSTQFRCSGSDGYLNWIDNTLNIASTANQILSKEEKMEFKIMDSPEELFQAIKLKNEEKENSARIVAGFCWPWSNPNPDGTLVNDVKIGNFEMPWEGREGFRLAPDIPPWYLWAYHPKGVNQIGCIYTIQGFEFDYVGVIIGDDLVYDPIKKEWVVQLKNNFDTSLKRKGDILSYLKNTYRVLLTRAHKGCFVYFTDENTRKFFESRINK